MEVWPDDPSTLAGAVEGKAGGSRGRADQHHGPGERRTAGCSAQAARISQLAAGLDNVDIPECTRRGILLGSHSGHSFQGRRRPRLCRLLLSSARRGSRATSGFAQQLGAGIINPTYWPRQRGAGQHLGIVGLGRSGPRWHAAPRDSTCASCITRATAAQRPEEQYGLTYASLDDLLTQSDFVSLHCP